MNRKEMSILAVILFLSAIAWIVFGVYHAKTSSNITQKELKQVAPLVPNFDEELLKKLSTREE